MDNFQFCSPTEFVFGRNTINQITLLVKRFKAAKILIHYGSQFAEKSGLIAKIEQFFQIEAINYIKLGGVQPNPVDTLVYEGIKLSQSEKVDFILALGGGSVIDSAKAIAAGYFYSGDFWDFFEGMAPINRALPVGVILTIPAAGSEGSPSMVITNTKKRLKRGIGSDLLRPVFSIMDPELTFSLPFRQTAYGVSDMIAHVMERYFTRTQCVDITDRMCEAVLISIIHSMNILIKEPTDYEARANIMWAGTVAHTGICGVGREEDWATHGLEHEISALYDNIAHGAGLSVMFPAWMKYVYESGISKFVQFSVRVWGIENNGNQKVTALKGIQALKDFFSSLGLPINFKQLGLKVSDIDYLVNTLKINSKGELGNFLRLNMEDARSIYKIAAMDN